MNKQDLPTNRIEAGENSVGLFRGLNRPSGQIGQTRRKMSSSTSLGDFRLHRKEGHALFIHSASERALSIVDECPPLNWRERCLQ
jgi:hypothetical protein